MHERAAGSLAWVVWASLALTGCLGPPVSAAPAAAAGNEPALAPASAAPVAPVVTPSGPLELRLDALGLSMDGQRLGALDALDYGVLTRLRERRAAGGAGTDPNRFRLAVDDAVKSDGVTSVFFLVTTAGYEDAELITSEGAVELCTLGCEYDARFADAVAAQPKGSRTVLVVHPKSLEVWRGTVGAPDSKGAGAPARPPERLLQASLDLNDAALVAALRRLCKRGGCAVPIGLLVSQGDAGALKRVLQLAARAWREGGGLAVFQPWEQAPGGPGEPLRADVFEWAREQERLPPAVIQRVVRANYAAFRKCYEAGLAQNPQLQGKVTVRFMIREDGNVSDVSNGGSDLPDEQVVACILTAVRGLSFPRPRGGFVTVVYPIMLQPG